ncbi:hypothetical protein BOW53_15575 [Solemya pervernicosa gill symbiont]|uniref:Uncharacterized protein n=2 Tax=Gammaproteobacteria incertae sedis TaxID=118884 RepID=A0A1T2L050_9GAMM|nr:hypothetical protein [Candidatus Reidiella endopervernicosa]OOZ38434.1 hypothetical protein BOW53_15575 [Solemya pervernicosa gill symbiont]QKQ27862.1 hypothetical protein HUE57_17430 [Candidatus Reidiella endopervernicosa]
MTTHHPLDSDYTLLEQPGGTTLRCRFSGRFDGEDVVWDATLMTLGQAGAARNFIEIGELSGQGRSITIALHVHCIDIPTLRKAIIMVRNYKRLRLGRHEYGPANSENKS